MNIDRLPPHSEEAEQGVLGCILWAPQEAMAEAQSIIGTESEWFYGLPHQKIYEAMLKLSDSLTGIDTITLQQQLKDDGLLEQVGGISYLMSLQDKVPSAANLSYYLTILREKCVLRKMIRTCTDLVGRAFDPGADTDALIDEAERDIMRISESRIAKEATGIKQQVREAISMIEESWRSDTISGLSTGLCDLDRATDGMHGGELIVICAFPNVGKSALSMNIVEHVAINEKFPVGVFSLEMSGPELVKRMIGSRSRVNLRSPLNEQHFRFMTTASGAISTSSIHIDDEADLSIGKLRAKARRLKQKHDIKLWVVDYLQLVTAPEVRAKDNREQEVGHVALGLKLMAKELKAPVLLLSQLNDEGKLRESRATGQHADAIWKLERQQGGSESGEPVKLFIEKQRNGPRTTIDLTFLPHWTRFESASKVSDEDVP